MQVKTVVQQQISISKKNKDGSTIPFYSKLLVLFWCTTITYNIFVESGRMISSYLLTFESYQFWRFLTCQYEDEHYLVNLLLLLVCFESFVKFQLKNCTVVLIYELIGINFVLHLFIISFSAIAYFLFNEHIDIKIGAGTIMINFLSKISYYYPTQFVPIKILPDCKLNNLYLLLVLVLSCLICLKIRQDMIFSLLLGFIQCYFCKGGILKYTMQTFNTAQKRFQFIKIAQLRSFINFYKQEYQQSQWLAIDPNQFYQKSDLEQSINQEEKFKFPNEETKQLFQQI